MDELDEKQHAVALGMIKGIGPVLARHLIAHCGSASSVFRTASSQLVKIPGIGRITAGLIRNSQVMAEAENEVAYCVKNDISILLYSDPLYPDKLRHCTDAPYLLYSKGKAIDSLSYSHKVIGIVGSRNATYYGKKITRSIVEGLKSSNVSIISGLALGIDGCAHSSSLDNNISTIAVLAHGFKTIYPYKHRKLAYKMLHGNGALITEYISDSPPDRMHFPARNRIVAGMADAVVVIESGASGGALITADIAHSYNREVFAVPGRIGDPMSEGCNNLIRYNKSALVRSGQDIFDYMGWTKGENQQSTSPNSNISHLKLNAQEKKIYGHISGSEEAVHMDEILKIDGLEKGKLHSDLLGMQLKGAIRILPGNTFAKA